jgi:hypothetical protein
MIIKTSHLRPAVLRTLITIITYGRTTDTPGINRQIKMFMKGTREKISERGKARDRYSDLPPATGRQETSLLFYFLNIYNVSSIWLFRVQISK